MPSNHNLESTEIHSSAFLIIFLASSLSKSIEEINIRCTNSFRNSNISRISLIVS